MKGSPEIIAILNQLLAEELTAINQYMVHSEMCENWKYERLHKLVERRAYTEMRHAEKLIERILFLEGSPTVSRLNEIRIGADVERQLRNDLDYEFVAQKGYNDGIRLCVERGDNATREILETILKDEEDHIDLLEGQLAQIEQIGIQGYLAQQVREPGAA